MHLIQSQMFSPLQDEPQLLLSYVSPQRQEIFHFLLWYTKNFT